MLVQKVRLKLLNILKVNSKLTSMTLYITFEAGDTSTGHGRIYQTSVYSPFKVEDAEVLLMRPKPENKPNEGNSPLNLYTLCTIEVFLLSSS